MGTQMSIGSLIAEIEKRQLLLPEFQRGYVWKRDKVRLYLDSLYKGYPTGTFLIWRTPNPGLVRGQGGADDGAAAFQLILDGQQRLTSIYALMRGKAPPFYEGERLYFDLYFNVKTEEFNYYKRLEMRGRPEWVPVTPFFQHGLGEYLKAGGPLIPEERDFLMDFFDRLVQLDRVKDYSYYMDVLGEKEMDEAVRIFNLVNSQGTALSKSDLALSHICALLPGMRQTMIEAQKRLAGVGFDFRLEFLTRCTAAVATGSGLYEPLYRETAEQIRAAWKKAQAAIEYLVDVLRFDAFIDASKQLPSDYPLVPLVVHLAANGARFRDEREKNSFLHWFYAAEMWGRYSGSSETKLSEDLEALRSEDPPAQLRANLIAERGRIRLEAIDLEDKTVLSPIFFMAYVVARAAGAIDWFNGLPLYNKLIGKGAGLEHHHIFPASLLYRSKYNSSDPRERLKVNQMANIAFLTNQANLRISNKEPAEYLAGVMERYPQALAAQDVPTNPALWRMEAVEDFFLERRQRLADRINKYMDSLLADGTSVPLTLQDYIRAGESETLEFKSSLRWDYNESRINRALERTIARTLAGFMNAKGGTLIVGISDDGQVLGLDADLKTLQQRNLDHWEQALRNALNAYLGKDVAALVQVTFGEVEGKTVAVVRADRMLKPVYLEEGGIALFFVRSGNTTQQLDVKQTLEYITGHFPAVAKT